MKKAAPNSNGHNNNTNIRKKPYKKSLAVRHLESLANDEAQKKYSEIPAEWLAKRKYRDDTANGLTKCIIDFLKLNNCWAERISNTGRLVDNQKSFVDITGRRHIIGTKKWIKGSGTNGTADISAIIEGKSVKIEVKMLNDKQSEAQKKYQEQVERAGGIYVIANSFEQFFNWVKNNFQIDES